jgi:hypothetical protein
MLGIILVVLIGIFCVLATIGFLVTDRPFGFAFKGIIFILAILFIVAVIFVIIELTQNNSTGVSGTSDTLMSFSQVSSLPTVIGQCNKTTVTGIGTRILGWAEGGSAIEYANKGYQVSYDVISGISNSRIGDPINFCLISIPSDCPPGDERGRIYQATNLRTNEKWSAPDSSHSCGGM